MNDLQHIRSMAEMIIQKVDAIDGTKTPESKFKVGDRVNTPRGDGVIILSDVTHGLMGEQSYQVRLIKDLTAWCNTACFFESQLTKIEGPKVAEPKFKVGDSVYFSYGKTNGVGVVHKLIVYGNHNDYLIHYPVNDVIANQWFSEESLSHTQPKVEDRVWHSGPPPHIGWWNASRFTNPSTWRWWDGEYWSTMMMETEDSSDANIWAKQRSKGQQGIQWTDYYPENARVPRINPGLKV
jgi:hypothetical protein